MLASDEYFALEGNGERNIFRVVTVTEMIYNNIVAFTNGFSTGFVALGIFNGRKQPKNNALL